MACLLYLYLRKSEITYIKAQCQLTDSLARLYGLRTNGFVRGFELRDKSKSNEEDLDYMNRVVEVHTDQSPAHHAVAEKESNAML